MFNNNSFGNSSFGGTSFGATSSGFGGFGTSNTMSAFGAPQQPAQQGPPIGTTIRFVPLTGTDTLAKPGTGGGAQQITTRHQNISAMKEYETKSVDELRLEDYLANRKHGQPQSAFGATQNLNTNVGFGQTNTNASTSSIFGSTAQQPSVTNNLFSSPSQNQSTNIFGQPKTDFGVGNTSNLFNNSLNKPATTVANSPFNIGVSNQFNTTATSTAPNNTSFPLFNSNTQSTVPAFGSNNTINSPFKTNQTTSLFGTNTSTSQPFGFPSTNTQQSSSSIFNTSLNASANKPAFSMPATSNSSFSFGATTNLPNTNTTNNTGLFGTGLSSNIGFGNQNKTTTPFNQSNIQGMNSTVGFGQTNTNTNTSSIFGSTPQQPVVGNNLFSSPAQQQSTNIFGQPKSDFGAANTTNSLFNKPATTVASSPFNLGGNSQFNTATTSTAPNNTSFNLFNSNTQTSAPAFGSTNSINNPFKTNQNTSLFGTNTSTSQPFGFTSSNTQQSTTSSIFNTSLNTGANKSAFTMPTTSNSSFSFGTTNNAANNTSITQGQNTGLFGTSLTGSLGFGSQNNNTTAFNQNSLQNNQTNPLQAQSQTANNQQSAQSPDLLMNRLKTLPYGETSLLLNETATSSPGLGSLKFTTDPKTINQYKINAKTNVKLNKPEPVEKPRVNSVLFDGLDENTSDDMHCAIDVFVPRRNIKKLDIGANSHLSEGDADRSRESSLFERNESIGRDTLQTPVTRHVRYSDNTVPGLGEYNRSSSRNQTTILSTSGSDLSSLRSFNRSDQLQNLSDLNNESVANIGGGCGGYKCGFVSSRPDYRVKPSLDEMERRYNREDDTCFVDSLLIERSDYGSILFESRINVKGLNIDDIVHIRRKEVIVYPDDENKPPVGRDLNRPAVVSLHQVWPVDKATNEVIKDVNRLKLMKYPEKIESATIEKGARFIEYRPETGTWMFAVKHFSKYGITDDDEDFSVGATAVIPKHNGSAHHAQDHNQHHPHQQAGSPLQQLNQAAQNVPQVGDQPISPITTNPALQSIVKPARPGTPIFLNQTMQPHAVSKSPVAKLTIPSKSKSETKFQMNPKTTIKLGDMNNGQNGHEKSRNESLMFESMDESSYSIKNVIEEFFTDEDALETLNDSKRSLSIHGTKRRALQNISPKASLQLNENVVVPITNTVPQQQKVRQLTKLKPDLYAARNKLSRDIMSVCVAGSPKVRFFNGSRKMCLVQNDTVLVYEVRLVKETNADGSLSAEVARKMDIFLEQNSTFKTLNTKPTLAPYIETNDFIPEAFSHDLLHALYGNLTTKTPYSKQDERLTRVISWLANFNSTLPEPSNFYQAILYHMSCDRYDLAAEMAIENDHPRLALLVGTFNIDKGVLFEQLTSWRLSHADQYIDHNLLKIYIILSSQTEWKLSDDVTIRVLSGLHWAQQLALLALHFPSFITEPERYYGFHMLPLHIRRLDTDTNDVDYHILARHSPAVILSAANSLLDEWFLAESLKSFHVINSEAECMQTDAIHCNLAAQLGPIDLRWACFIALHIFNNEVRNQVLIACLEQNHGQLCELRHDLDKPMPMRVQDWLTEKLKIPVEFIENSKRPANTKKT